MALYNIDIFFKRIVLISIPFCDGPLSAKKNSIYSKISYFMNLSPYDEPAHSFGC